jgi:hypothetical protein
VNARLLDVLHHSADDRSLAVGKGVDVDLQGVFKELVDENVLSGGDVHRLLDDSVQCGRVADDRHASASKHIAGPHEQRIAEFTCDALGLGQ